MQSQNRPRSPNHAPDASHSYERNHPSDQPASDHDNPIDATPTDAPDVIEKTVKHRQDPSHQINGEDVIDQRDRA